jgi:Ca-activated chloride channel family protein
VSLLTPWALLALLAVPALLLAIRAWNRHRPPRGVPFPDLATIAAAAPADRLRRHLPLAFAILAIAAFSFALARPQVWRSEPREQATIMLAVDVSGSMAADDVEPTRMAAAQEAARRFAETVPRQYQIGLVSFSGQAQTLLPPTTDRLAFQRALDGLLAYGATAIGDAVASSLEAIRQSQGGIDQPQAARILLLSDGANTAGLPIEVAAREARRAGVPVYTVALGTEEGVLPDGRRVPPDPEGLERLAEITGADAFESRDAGAVSSVYEKLGSFIGTRRVKQEVTAWPAGLGALLLVLAGGAYWRFGARLR